MKVKKIVALMLALALVLGMTACGASGGSKKEEEVLKVGTMALTMGVPVLYAQEKGYFQDAGLNVSVELFATGAPIY